MNAGLKVLVCAYACSPYKGSEPGVGWGFVSELAQCHDLWVIVEEEKFREDIERYLTLNPGFGERVHFYFIHKKRHRILRKLWPPSYYWYYKQWHSDALRLGRRLQSEVGFDVVHQLTMVGFREPGYLWQLGVPFVWGPVGGMGFFPARFLGKIGVYGAVYYLGYNVYNWLQMFFMRRPRRAAKGAGLGLMAINEENQYWLARLYGVGSQICSAVGPPEELRSGVRARELGQPLRVIWVGQHKPGKALNLALEALSLLRADISWTIDIAGSGIMTQKWKELARKLAIEHRCVFHGTVSRDEVLQLMEKCDVHLLTSLREGTPTVIVEAFSAGLPTVCLDCCGMRDMVDVSCGIKIPVTTPREVVRGIVRALEEIATNEPLRLRLAAGAIERARSFSWRSKAETVQKIYASKSTQSQFSEPPSFTDDRQGRNSLGGAHD